MRVSQISLPQKSLCGQTTDQSIAAPSGEADHFRIINYYIIIIIYYYYIYYIKTNFTDLSFTSSFVEVKTKII